MYGLHICAAETQRSVKQDRGVMSHIKWPVRTCYLFISLYRCLFLSLSLSLFSLRHVWFRRTLASSPAQFKGKINMDKPPWEYWPLQTSTILFNVLDCTLMDTPSHTSSNHLALSHPHFFFPPFSAVFHLQGNLLSIYSWQYHFQSWEGSIIQWLAGSRGGDLKFQKPVLCHLIEVSVEWKCIWGTPLDKWRDRQCDRCIKSKEYIGRPQYIIRTWEHLSHKSRCAQSELHTADVEGREINVGGRLIVLVCVNLFQRTHVNNYLREGDERFTQVHICLVGLWAGLHKTYWTDFWMEDWSRPRIDLIN